MVLGPGGPFHALRQVDWTAQVDDALVIRTPAPFTQAEVESAFGFTLQRANLRAVEAYFHYCLTCDRDIAICSCHDAGKGDQ